MENARILIVEDSPTIREVIKHSLLNAGYLVTGFADRGDDAVRIAGDERPDIVLMDIVLKDGSTGINAAKEIALQFFIPVIYLTAISDEEEIDEALKSAPYGYLVKPVEERTLRATIEMARSKHELDLKLRESEERLKNALSSVVEEKALWELTFDAVPDLIAILSPNQKIIKVNRPMAERLGISQEQAVGMYCFKAVHARDAPIEYCPHIALIGDNKEHVSLIHEERLGGYFIVSVSPIIDETGKNMGSVHVARDVTEQKRMEDALRRAHTQVNLLSSITRHDILNSVTAILGYIFLAKTENLSERTKNLVEKLEVLTHKIQRQIEFTKEYQDLGIHEPVWSPLSTIVKNSSRTFENSPLKIVYEGGPVEILADPLIEKVFSNLIDNSLRHGEHADTIRIYCTKGESGLMIIYEDNGAGIPNDIKNSIFKRGFGKNTGLGLYLVREVLGITGMQIDETGIPGRGARFEISVPREVIRDYL